MEGVLKGDICNREGCQGVIDEYEGDGSCSCHINPPCSYCVESREYCPLCGWVAAQSDSKGEPSTTSNYNTVPYKERELDNTKIDWHSRGHTHFSMIKEGVYPEGTSRSDVSSVVKGTFGGRFVRFGNGKFKYIAYTD